MSVTAISAGGWACTLKVVVDDEHEPYVVRITANPDALEDIALHSQLDGIFQWGSARLIGEPQQCKPLDIPDVYVAAMNTNPRCAAHLQTWFDRPLRTTITMYQMEYADVGQFNDVNVAQHDDIFRRLVFLLIGLLYAGQWRIGFEHGDLTGSNILIGRGDDDDDGDIVPKIIDFDFASHGGAHNNPDRRLGSYHVLPYEFAATQQPTAIRTVLGAVDVWALGMCVFSKLISNNAYAAHYSSLVKLKFHRNIDKKLDGPMLTFYTMCALHSLLSGLDYETTYANYFKPRDVWDARSLGAVRRHVMKAARGQFGPAIEAILPDARELLLRMLHLDPMKRVFNGDMYRYFQMAYFTNVLDTQALLGRYIFKLFSGANVMPNTMVRPVKAQIRAAHEFGLALRCGQCRDADADYLNEQLGMLVCNECAQ
jgi:hypothetical protein